VNINRRYFLLGTLASTTLAALAATVVPAITSEQDEYSEFLKRVRNELMAIAHREKREILGYEIDPPKAGGKFYTRQVRVRLAAGPSLLDRVSIPFTVVSGRT
jgi:hypothetical protein